MALQKDERKSVELREVLAVDLSINNAKRKKRVLFEGACIELFRSWVVSGLGRYLRTFPLFKVSTPSCTFAHLYSTLSSNSSLS